VQSLEGVHPLGVHHLVTAKEARRAASVGFGGEVKIWSEGEDGMWKAYGEISGRCAHALSTDPKAAQVKGC